MEASDQSAMNAIGIGTGANQMTLLPMQTEPQ